MIIIKKKFVPEDRSESGNWHSLKMCGQSQTWATRYPIICTLMVASLLGSLLTLNIGAWNFEVASMISVLKHKGQFSEYYNSKTTNLLIYPGWFFFATLTLLTIFGLKNAFDFACLMMDREDSLIFKKVGCLAAYRDKLEIYYINLIVHRGFVVTKKEDQTTIFVEHI